MARFHFSCVECGETYHEDPKLLVCPVCSSKQVRGGTIRGVLEVVIKSMPSKLAALPRLGPGVSRAPFCPSARSAPSRRFQSGDTPLIEARRLRQETGMPHLWVKDDTRNPSGSTKDRASLLVVAKAVEYGFDTVATASTGNAATALAAVAAAAGVRAVVLVPASAPPAKLVQMQSYGAIGHPDRRLLRSRPSSSVSRPAIVSAGTTAAPPSTRSPSKARRPPRLEIAVALSLDSPDVVLVPTGDGVILGGLAKGFRDLESRRPPRPPPAVDRGSAGGVRGHRPGPGPGMRRPQNR